MSHRHSEMFIRVCFSVLGLLLGFMIGNSVVDAKNSKEYLELRSQYDKFVNDEHNRWVYVCDKYGENICTNSFSTKE